MTATPTAALSSFPTKALVPPPLAGPAGVPFGRLVRTELRKLTDTRSGRWLVTAITAITPLVVVIMLFTAKPQSLTYDKFVDITQTPQKFLLPVLGILTVTTEWSQRTGLVTFTLAPHRGRVLRAKAAATGLLGLLVIAVAFGAAAIGNLLGAALRHGNGSWAFGVGGFRDILIVQLSGLAQGLAFGMLLLISAAAIIAYYVLPTLSTFAFGSIPALKADKSWFDLNSAQTPLYNHDITGQGWAQLLVAVAIWVALPAVFGVLRVLRSEIKST
jgi:ABC-type transport system involved in multi-copper enzyme maturation permease subunit